MPITPPFSLKTSFASIRVHSRFLLSHNQKIKTQNLKPEIEYTNPSTYKFHRNTLRVTPLAQKTITILCPDHSALTTPVFYPSHLLCVSASLWEIHFRVHLCPSVVQKNYILFGKTPNNIQKNLRHLRQSVDHTRSPSLFPNPEFSNPKSKILTCTLSDGTCRKILFCTPCNGTKAQILLCTLSDGTQTKKLFCTPSKAV